MALTRTRAQRQGPLWLALCLLLVLQFAIVHASDAAASNATAPTTARTTATLTATTPSTTTTTTTTTTAAGFATPAPHARRTSLRPGCRTFYVHGDAHGEDGAEYDAQLLWQEHAVPDGEGRWTLAVNVTATEGARIVLGGAAKPLPGQPRYELVLGALANESRLLVQAQPHTRDAAAAAVPCRDDRPLFETGSLQLWLRWKVEHSATRSAGRLEALAQTAGSPDTLLLLSYETSVPLQLETFSFGSNRPGDVTFDVCKASSASSHGGSERTGARPGTGPGLGAPGCRSLILHKAVQGRSHTMAVGWADVADSHGRMQFWARASTDVEVFVSERLPGSHRGNHAMHHVVFGGDFNTRSWVTEADGPTMRRRGVVVATPALLSDVEFRPLWVAVPPHAHGVVKAGSGEVGHHLNASTASTANTRRELISWANPKAPASLNFVTFATYRNRLVHVLIDCEEAPSAARQAGGNGVGLLDAVRDSAASAFSSARGRGHGAAGPAPTLELDIERLAVHNESVTATGTLMQKWQYGNGSGIEWDPAWFQGVLKFQYWLTDMDELLEEGDISNLLVVSSGGRNKSHSKLVPGPIEVNSDKNISWNFHLHLKMPCEYDEKQETMSCSVTAKLNSNSNSCIEISTSNLDQKWKVDWKTDKSRKDGKCQISLTVTTKHRTHEKYVAFKQHTGFILWLYILLTSLALVILCIGYHPLSKKNHCLLSMPKILIKKLQRRQDFRDERVCIVAYDGGAAHINNPDPEDLNSDVEEKNKVKPQPENYLVIKQQKIPIVLLSLSLCLSVTDLLMKLAIPE